MPRFLLHSEVIADYRGIIASPGAVLLDGDTIVAVGAPEEIGHLEDVPITQINGMTTPSFVNAHSHLDLSGVGTVPCKDSFANWLIEIVRPIRQERDSISKYVQKGVALSLAGGCRIVGDIAGSQLAAQTARDSELLPVSFVELIGFGKGVESAISTLHAIPDQFEASPHAPYTCSQEVFAACFDSGKKVATHVAESLPELEFIAHHRGELYDYLVKLDAWDEQMRPWECHPVDAILQIANGKPFLAAHLNYIEDRHLELIGQSNMSVVYCPRASAYFGHANHRWKEMIDAGITVALGTDSLLCLDTPERLSVLDEMRLLYARDAANPNELMKMATVYGTKALGLDCSLVTLSTGKTAGLLSFEGIASLDSLLSSETAPKWILQP
ncbi:MAG: amidohydrolase family protein [Planctomycetes bacterium]|nr:amidohydrolase family protein [Planctomycetota bacterium]